MPDFSTETLSGIQLEAAKFDTQQIMNSQFGYFPERVDIRLDDITEIRPHLEEDDTKFRNTLLPIIRDRHLPKTFVLLDLATQHTMATLKDFYFAGFDCYMPFFPLRTQSMIGGYEPIGVQRVLEVATFLPNKQSILSAKKELNKRNLRGVMVNIHSHAKFAVDAGEYDKYLPSTDLLRALGITNMLFLSETSQDAGGRIDRDINNRLTDEDKQLIPFETRDRLTDYVKAIRKSGFVIKAVGIDNRQPRDGYNLFSSDPLPKIRY